MRSAGLVVRVLTRQISDKRVTFSVRPSRLSSRGDHPTAQSPRGGDRGAGQNNTAASEAKPQPHALAGLRRSLASLVCASLLMLNGRATGSEQAAVAPTCAARVVHATSGSIAWHAGPVEDTGALDQWCRGVGPPVFVPAPAAAVAVTPPALRDIVVVSWNAHLADGRLADLIAALRAGHLTNGEPVHHFVLLLQELYRRGRDVPPFAASARSAFAITARDPRAADVNDHARTLGLATLYVPSMRNGAEVFEDRGNAIVSTERLLDPLALDLPFERQRRVAIGASIMVRTAAGATRLNVVNAHLEPLSSPASLWVFRNPRRRQVAALLDLLRRPRFEAGGRVAGTVLGGDFNTIQGGMEEDAYARARAWSHSLISEDTRSTHHMGRIDYLFFRLTPEWLATSARMAPKFGSDHHPVLGRFVAAE